MTKTAESLPAFKKLETTEEKAEFIEDFLNNNMDMLTIQSKYRNTAGEQEARDVQNRINMSKEERQRKLPFIKNEDTIYVQNEVENNSNKLYNADRGDINERQTNQRNDRRRVQELLEIYEQGKRNENTDYEKLYGIKKGEEVTERKVKEEIIKYADKYQKSSLTVEEKKLKNIINQLNGDVIFYEYGQENYFQGLSNKNTFYIDSWTLTSSCI